MSVAFLKREGTSRVFPYRPEASSGQDAIFSDRGFWLLPLAFFLRCFSQARTLRIVQIVSNGPGGIIARKQAATKNPISRLPAGPLCANKYVMVTALKNVQHDASKADFKGDGDILRHGSSVLRVANRLGCCWLYETSGTQEPFMKSNVSLVWFEKTKLHERSFINDVQAIRFASDNRIPGFSQVTTPRGSVIANLANVGGQVVVHYVQ